MGFEKGDGRMAWGYEAHFIVEHDDTLKKRISCKDCLYYERDDKSCLKRPLYLPEDGYNSWRKCNYFELDPSVSNYEQKLHQYEVTLNKNSIEKLKSINGTDNVEKSIDTNEVTVKQCKRFNLILSSGKNMHKKKSPKKKLLYKYLTVYLSDGRKKKIQIGFRSKNAYVNTDIYTEECINEVIKIFNSK